MNNLACRTDAIFHRRDGFIDAFPTHWVIRTPSNPSFWFGNYLLFREAPRSGQLASWLDLHRATFGSTLNHTTLGWDEPKVGEISQFIEAGFKPSHGISLSISAYHGGIEINPDLIVRPLHTAQEWEAMLQQQIQIDTEDLHFPEDNGVFRRRQMEAAQTMVDDHRGHWWGAFRGPELVGGMGLFFDEAETIGRFQYVTTARAYRRQRVCTTLLDHIVRHAFATVKPECLVICTDADEKNAAIPTYLNFGFEEKMRSYAVFRLEAKAGS